MQEMSDGESKVSDEGGSLDLISKIFLTVLAFFILVVGIVGNFFTCFVVFRKPSMRSAINLLVSMVALSDFCLVAVCFPFSVVSLFSNEWMVNLACKFHAFFHSLFLVENASVLTAISVDHYLIIVHRHDRLTLYHARLVIFITLILSTSLCLPGLLKTSGYSSWGSAFTQCEIACAHSAPDRMYVLLIFSVIFLIPVAVITFAFVRIVSSVRNNCLRIGSYPVINQSYKNPAKRYMIPSPRRPHYFFDDVRFKTRTFSTISILFIVFFLCRAPYAIGITTMNLIDSKGVFTHTYLLWWNFLNPALNPVIYAWRIRKLREAYCRCFPRICTQVFHMNPSPKIKPYTISQLHTYYRTMNFHSSII